MSYMDKNIVVELNSNIYAFMVENFDVNNKN
jgi:hypothetical protein